MDRLVTGPVFRFADWPNDQVPHRAAGVYTVWRQEEFLCVGMSGRGASAEDFVLIAKVIPHMFRIMVDMPTRLSLRALLSKVTDSDWPRECPADSELT